MEFQMAFSVLYNRLSTAYNGAQKYEDSNLHLDKQQLPMEKWG
jgi:hypothetical protein